MLPIIRILTRVLASASTFANIQDAFALVREMLTGNNYQPSVLDRDRDHSDRFELLGLYESKHILILGQLCSSLRQS